MELQAVFTQLCPDRIYDRHCHTHYEIIYVMDGSVTVNLEGSHYLLEKGSCIVIEPLRYHIVTGNNTLYNRLLVDFKGCEIPEDLRQLFTDRVASQPVFMTQELSALFEKLQLLHDEYGQRHGPLLGAIFTQLLYLIAFTEVAKQTAPEERKNRLLRSVIEYVDAHMAETVSLQDLSAHLFVSESTLCHLFKEEMKIPLKQYILRKKMMYAKSLILSGTAPGEAAESCGYKNYASFYKIFLKFTGVTPVTLAKKEMKNAK